MDRAISEAARHALMLDELGQLAMGVAREMAQRVTLARTDADAAEAAHAFERVSRAVRMCLALEQRLTHERRRGAEQDRAAATLDLDHRKKQIRAAVGRAIQEEIGGAEQFGLKVRLDDRLEEEVLFDTLAEGPVEMHIDRIRKILGLAPLAAGADDPADGDLTDNPPPCAIRPRGAPRIPSPCREKVAAERPDEGPRRDSG